MGSSYPLNSVSKSGGCFIPFGSQLPLPQGWAQREYSSYVKPDIIQSQVDSKKVFEKPKIKASFNYIGSKRASEIVDEVVEEVKKNDKINDYFIDECWHSQPCIPTQTYIRKSMHPGTNNRRVGPSIKSTFGKSRVQKVIEDFLTVAKSRGLYSPKPRVSTIQDEWFGYDSPRDTNYSAHKSKHCLATLSQQPSVSFPENRSRVLEIESNRAHVAPGVSHRSTASPDIFPPTKGRFSEKLAKYSFSQVDRSPKYQPELPWDVSPTRNAGDGRCDQLPKVGNWDRHQGLNSRFPSSLIGRTDATAIDYLSQDLFTDTDVDLDATFCPPVKTPVLLTALERRQGIGEFGRLSTSGQDILPPYCCTHEDQRTRGYSTDRMTSYQSPGALSPIQMLSSRNESQPGYSQVQQESNARAQMIQHCACCRYNTFSLNVDDNNQQGNDRHSLVVNGEFLPNGMAVRRNSYGFYDRNYARNPKVPQSMIDKGFGVEAPRSYNNREGEEGDEYQCSSANMYPDQRYHHAVKLVRTGGKCIVPQNSIAMEVSKTKRSFTDHSGDQQASRSPVLWRRSLKAFNSLTHSNTSLDDGRCSGEASGSTSMPKPSLPDHSLRAEDKQISSVHSFQSQQPIATGYKQAAFTPMLQLSMSEVLATSTPCIKIGANGIPCAERRSTQQYREEVCSGVPAGEEHRVPEEKQVTHKFKACSENRATPKMSEVEKCLEQWPVGVRQIKTCQISQDRPDDAYLLGWDSFTAEE